MNIKYFLLSLLLLLVPACRKKPRYATAPAVATESIAPEKAEYDEELGAFVVKEDENKFSAAAASQAQQEEQLTGLGSDATVGDIHSDSAQYGLKTIFFEFDRYKLDDLRADQRPVLEHDLKVAKSLSDKGYKLVLEGHACNSAGSTDYNMALSADRAQAVKQYFRDHGIIGEIETVGRGCAHLIVPSGNAEQQAPNRRVEIYAYEIQEKA